MFSYLVLNEKAKDQESYIKYSKLLGKNYKFEIIGEQSDTVYIKLPDLFMLYPSKNWLKQGISLFKYPAKELQLEFEF